MRTRASSRFEAVYNVLSSAVDRREVLGVAVGEWSNIVFCYTILQNGPTGISKGEKLANVVKMLPKLGFTDKRKIPNRCFTAIWDSFQVVLPELLNHSVNTQCFNHL